MRTLADALPEVASMLDQLGSAVASGTIESVDEFVAACRGRWDGRLVEHVDGVLPGWGQMASFADGKTLWHVTIAMVALARLDEYAQATTTEQHLMEWTVLLHDIAKEPAHDRRDHRHAFRSAAVAAGILPQLGAATTREYARSYAGWRDRVFAAWTDDAAAGEPVPDNRPLPGIAAGIDQMFEPDPARVLTAILLHQSVTVVSDWPSLAPLTPAEETTYITPRVAALQLPLMLADSGGWNLFDPGTLRSMYHETRAVFARIASKYT